MGSMCEGCQGCVMATRIALQQLQIYTAYLGVDTIVGFEPLPYNITL
jgi:hypothetical protein